MRVMKLPVTTGGKKRTRRRKYGASRKPSTPATMVAPKMTGSAWPGAADSPMAIMGVTPAKETPLTNGSRAPIRPTPSVCSSVAMPAVKRLAPMRTAVSGGSSPTAGPMIIGGATTPAYMAATCWSPLASVFPGGSVASTGCGVPAARPRARAEAPFCPGARSPLRFRRRAEVAASVEAAVVRRNLGTGATAVPPVGDRAVAGAEFGERCVGGGHGTLAVRGARCETRGGCERYARGEQCAARGVRGRARGARVRAGAAGPVTSVATGHAGRGGGRRCSGAG